MSSYDAVPYHSRPRYATHPDCLATRAALAGLDAAPPDRCRYLELGCSTGGNLLPMAEALPHSTFVGVDLSAAQIDAGRAVAAELGLRNLRLDARSILDLDDSFGTFDYVVAHGVYSWVPAAVRERLLYLCNHLLAPHGVAYVSYNTLPGWHLRAPARELMNFHVRHSTDPHEKAREARAILEFAAGASSEPDDLWARLLNEEADIVRPEGDYYILHEHLEPNNHPVTFTDFVEHAASHGLRYLGEASLNTDLSSRSPQVQAAVQRLTPDPIARQQYLDFLEGRTFRRTLLVHDDIFPRPASADVVRRLLISGASRPTGDEPESATAVEGFRNDEGRVLETNVPLVKAALRTLFETWPRAWAFEELHDRVRGVAADDGSRALLADALVRLYAANLVGLHVHVPGFVVEPGERPTATPLARRQAAGGLAVTNRRHRAVPLTALERRVLARLDGRDRAALAADLALSVEELGAALERLGVAALLVG